MIPEAARDWKDEPCTSQVSVRTASKQADQAGACVHRAGMRVSPPLTQRKYVYFTQRTLT